jgi:hypothetical protein
MRSANAERSAKVKIMLLAILPNWNSLDSVREAHSDLELAGLVFFALLVVAEALAHNSKQEERKHLFDSIGIWFFAIAILCEIAGYWYGQRNDALSEQVISSLDVKARNAASNASTALDKSGTALSNSKEAESKSSDAIDKAGKAREKVEGVAKQAAQIDAELWQAEYLMSARRVENTEKLADELKKKFKGRDIVLMSYRGDQEGWGLCTQLWYVANSAEMKPVNECGVEDFAIPGIAGNPPMSALVSPLAVSGPNIQETLDIGQMLVTIGRLPFGTTSGMLNGMLMIFVGVKPPFMIGQARGVRMPTKKQTKKQSAKP